MANAEYYLKLLHRDILANSTIIRMEPAARGIYFILICHQYEDGSLPADKRELMKLAMCQPRDWKHIEPFLDQCFPIQSDGTRQNPDIAAQRSQTKEKRAKLAENGQKGGRPPKENGTKEKPNGFEKETKSEPSGDTSKRLELEDANASIPPTAPQGDDGDHQSFVGEIVQTDAWAEFKTAYPERAGDRKDSQGEIIFHRLIKNGEDSQTLIDGATRYCKYMTAESKTGTRFVMAMPKFLNGKCWQESWQPSGKSETVDIIGSSRGVIDRMRAAGVINNG